MRIGTLTLALGFVVGAASVAQAQTAVAAADPVSDLQTQFGAIVGDAFHRPDPIIAATSGPGSPVREAGFALRTSLEVPGAIFAGMVKPFADLDQADAPPAPAPAPQHRVHARVHRRHVAARN